MTNDAFTAGVVPGGLISHSEVKILICYLMRAISAPVAHQDMVGALTEEGLANYFEIVGALAELTESGHLVQQGEDYLLKDTGWQIAELLSDDLPVTVKERALNAVTGAIEYARKRRQNLVEIQETESGFIVNCKIVDETAGPLYGLSIYAPTKDAARKIRENFIDNADLLLRQDLSLLTGQKL